MRINGYKTYISLVLLAVTYYSDLLGIAPAEMTPQLEAGLMTLWLIGAALSRWHRERRARVSGGK